MHPYQAGAAHTNNAPHVLPPSVEYLHSVKISAYTCNTNVQYNIQPNPNGSQTSIKRRGWGGEEKREKADVVVRGRSGGVGSVEESTLRQKVRPYMNMYNVHVVNLHASTHTCKRGEGEGWRGSGRGRKT